MQPTKVFLNGSKSVFSTPSPIFQTEEQPLHGKVSLIIGGDSENGRLLALALAEKGSDIVVVCLNGLPTPTLHLKQQVEAAGSHCLLISGDPRSRGFAEYVIEEIVETFGHLDVFIDYSPQSDDPFLKQNRLFPNLAMITAALGEIASEN